MSDEGSRLRLLPQGRYRVYGDIVHESGYAQTLVAAVDLPGRGGGGWDRGDPDDSWFTGEAAGEGAVSRFALDEGPT